MKGEGGEVVEDVVLAGGAAFEDGDEVVVPDAGVAAKKKAGLHVLAGVEVEVDVGADVGGGVDHQAAGEAPRAFVGAGGGGGGREQAEGEEQGGCCGFHVATPGVGGLADERLRGVGRLARGSTPSYSAGVVKQIERSEQQLEAGEAGQRDDEPVERLLLEAAGDDDRRPRRRRARGSCGGSRRGWRW